MKARLVLIPCALFGLISFLCAGCVVYTRPAVAVSPAPAIVEPPPAYRVYIYDPGFPPGCYLYNGFYFWRGHRYAHDVFVNKIVNVNIQNHRYMGAEKNRTAGKKIEQHVTEYNKSHGQLANKPKYEPSKENEQPKGSK